MAHCVHAVPCRIDKRFHLLRGDAVRLNFTEDKEGKTFHWEGQQQRIYGSTNNIWRDIFIDSTYLLNEDSEKMILQTVAHEFGHAMTMFGRHAVQALFRPWARYFGETNPRQYDERDDWHHMLQKRFCEVTEVQDVKKYGENKWTAEEMRKLQISLLYSPVALELQIKTLRI